MDQEKIGRFLSDLRRDAGLTQEQLGERICVTSKTVSRWETGKYLPPADILMKLSELYGVSVNEILSGRRLDESEYRGAAEKNLVIAVENSAFGLSDRIEFFKKKWLREHIALIIVLGVILAAFFSVGIILKKPIILSLTPLLLLVFHCIRHNSMMSYVEGRVYGGKSEKLP